MQFGVRYVLDGNENVDYFEAANITCAHDRVEQAAVGGVLTAFNLWVKSHVLLPSEALQMCYDNLGGDTIAYTLLIEGGQEEHGIADVSRDRCRKAFIENWTDVQKEVVKSHDHNNCPNGEACAVLNLVRTFDLEEYVASLD